MKYLTRQLWHDSQKGHIQFMLKANGEAKYFSEDYFQRLYQDYMNNRMTGYLEWAEEDDLKRRSAEEFAADGYLGQLFRLNRYLPPEIKDEIADIRVAALGFVTQDILEKITAFCENIREKTGTVINMYEEYYKTIKNSIPKRIRTPLSRQHDAHIKKIGALNGDYIIETGQRYAGYAEYTITFKNASIIQDIEKSGLLSWSSYEIYLQNGGYEVHILFHVYYNSFEKDMEHHLTDLIVFAEDIEVETVTHELERYTEFL